MPRWPTLRASSSVLALVLALSAIVPSRADNPPAAGDPEVQAAKLIDKFDANLLDVMQRADKLGYDGRYKQLEPAVDMTFDLPLMTQILSGTAWKGWSDSQRNTVIAAFRNYTIATYARRFDGYDGESFKVMGTNSGTSGILVQTDLVRASDNPVVINYLTRPNASGAIKVVDIFLTGAISQLATQRSEFGAVIERDGFDGLVRSLNERASPANILSKKS